MTTLKAAAEYLHVRADNWAATAGNSNYSRGFTDGLIAAAHDLERFHEEEQLPALERAHEIIDGEGDRWVETHDGLYTWFNPGTNRLANMSSDLIDRSMDEIRDEHGLGT